jgi:DNA processing protein
MTVTTRSTTLPPEAWAFALSLLPGCEQRRLAAVLAAADHDPEAAWQGVVRGRVPDEDAVRGAARLRSAWQAAAARIDPSSAWRRLSDDGIGVWLLHGDGYPARLAADPDPPPILFWRGDPQALERPAVAIVGTRRCTAYGTDVARALGHDLSAAGVAVVSGLALGIDGAAHEGALAGRLTDALSERDDDLDPLLHTNGETAGDRGHGLDVDPTLGANQPAGPGHALGAPPIGVVGSGLDVVYPPRHRQLWNRVGTHGLLLTEAPPGTSPEPWRFPRRNRVLAALADLVIVVESHARGGSLSTVRAAIDRGIPVMAVPGSVRSPSSAGTNRLLADGAAPVTDVDDVLVALSLEGVTLDRTSRAPTAGHGHDRDDDDPLLAAVEWTPTSTEDVLRRTGLDLPEASRRLTQLELAGKVRRRGGWWELVGTAR